MVVYWKVILTIFILHAITIDGNRVRRRRRQVQLQNPNLGGNNIAPSQPYGPNPNQPSASNDIPTGRQANRQSYYPYQGQMGYGSIQSLNYPYAGAGVGAYNYGTGQYGQMGSYGNYYNPNQGSNSFYSGYGGNRPGYSSNYYPSSYGGNYFGGGGYYWGAGEKNSINRFLLLLSTCLTFIVYIITN